MKFNMHGKNAAVLAEGAYRVAAAKASTSDNVKRDADLFAQRAQAFDADQAEEAGLVEDVTVTPMEAVVGQSGGFVKETAGFGVLLERNGGQKGEYILAMRGTVGPEGRSKDWFSNYQIGLTRGPTGSLVHSGFMDIYRSMQVDVQRMITGARPQRIHFIGHSLGGALATIAAIDYARNGTATSHLYTFGAPRVGSHGLASDVEKLIGVERLKRVYSISDPVPMIPLVPFCHVGPGSIGFADSKPISGDAHSMLGNYIPQMPATGWPPEMRMSTKSDPGYWLTQAESHMGFGSGIGYFLLAKALKGILYLAANSISAALTVGFTVADALMTAIRSGLAIAKKIEGYMLRFVKAALKFAGVAVAATTVTAADLTVSFLRWILDMVMRPIRVAVSAAIRTVT
ncbi:MAG: lipase family protein [Pseudomonadota bacterium]